MEKRAATSTATFRRRLARKYAFFRVHFPRPAVQRVIHQAAGDRASRRWHDLPSLHLCLYGTNLSDYPLHGAGADLHAAPRPIPWHPSHAGAIAFRRWAPCDHRLHRAAEPPTAVSLCHLHESCRTSTFRPKRYASSSEAAPIPCSHMPSTGCYCLGSAIPSPTPSVTQLPS